MKLILLSGFVIAASFLLVALYRWANGLKRQAPQDLTLEEYRRVHETASSRRPSKR